MTTIPFPLVMVCLNEGILVIYYILNPPIGAEADIVGKFPLFHM